MMVRKLRGRLAAMSLRARIIVGTVILMAIMTLSMIGVVKLILERQLEEEIHKRGLTFARHIADHAVNHVLTEDFLSLRLFLDEHIYNEEDIVYIFLLDEEGRLLAHTFGNLFPMELKEANTLEAGQRERMQLLSTEEGEIYDVAYSLLPEGEVILRLGLSVISAVTGLDSVLRMLFVAGLIILALAALIAVAFDTSITRPVMDLIRSARKIEAGDFDRKVEVAPGGEIGKLAMAFNAMVDGIRRSREEMLILNRRLEEEVSQKEEAIVKLQRSQARQRAILEAVPDMMFRLDRDGRYLEFIPAPEAQPAVLTEQFLNREISDILPEDLSAKMMETLTRTLETGELQTLEYSLPIILPDGEDHDFEARFAPSGDGEVLTIVRDISVAKRTREALRQSEQELSTIFESAPGLMILVDRERRVQRVNHGGAEFSGRTRGEMIGLRSGEAIRCFHALKNPRGCGFSKFCPSCPIRFSIIKVLETGEAYLNMEASLPFVRGDKRRERDLLISSTPITIDGEMMVLISIDDLTDIKKMRRDLLESEERFRLVVEAMDDFVFLLDRDQRYIGIWGHWLEKHGLSPEDFLGKTFWEVFGGETREFFEGINMKVLAGEGCAYGRWFDMPRGKIFYHTTVTPFRDVSGEVIGIVGLGRDITDLKKAEEDLKRTRDDLEVKNVELMKLDRVKDGLIRDVTHELKTPVAKQAMQLEILKEMFEGIGMTKEASRIMNIMDSSLKRQEGVISNILTLSRLEAGGRKYVHRPFRIDRLLQEIIDDYQLPLSTYGMQADTNMEEVTISSDRDMLWHVFSNLINNSIKYRRKKGRPKLSVILEKKGREAVVKIADNGIGLSRNEKERIFERFYQATPAGEGIGVGLTIARMIVKGLGGVISIESAGKARGSVAEVRLPLIGGVP